MTPSYNEYYSVMQKKETSDTHSKVEESQVHLLRERSQVPCVLCTPNIGILGKAKLEAQKTSQWVPGAGVGGEMVWEGAGGIWEG